MNKKEKTLNTRRSGIGKPICVRVDEKQHRQLLADSIVTGKKIPSLLRDNYFERVPTNVLFHREDAKKLFKELNRIGVNINQMARAMNMGVLEGWSRKLEEVKNEVIALKDLVVTNGVCESA